MHNLIVSELAQVYEDSLLKHSYRRNLDTSEIQLSVSYQHKMSLLSKTLPDLSIGSTFRSIIPLLPTEESNAMSQLLINMVLQHFLTVIKMLNTRTSFFIQGNVDRDSVDTNRKNSLGPLGQQSQNRL